MSDKATSIRRGWGSDDFFYDELETFLKSHMDGEVKADAIEYDNESKLPIRAVYYFRPYRCYVENIQLRAAIVKANEEQPK